MNITYKINNQSDWIACQKYLFKLGYSWINHKKSFHINNGYYPCYITTEDDYFFYWSEKLRTENFLDFNKIIREYKLKRILK